MRANTLARAARRRCPAAGSTARRRPADRAAPARPPAQRPTISARPPVGGADYDAGARSTPARRVPIPYPVFESKAFARAVARGTRTRTGQPGPNYWQQFARYRIDAELVPATNQINGRETVRYYNRSPDTLRVHASS